MPQLTKTNIQLNAEQPSSLTFLLLQTHLSTLITNPTSISAESLDRISFELYQQYLKTKQERQNNQSQSNIMLHECNNMIQDYKSNQDELIEISKDRLRLVRELKEATDEALSLMEENDKLTKMVSLLSELNSSLTSQNQIMQNQFTSLNTKKEQQTSSIRGLTEEYDSILSSNQIMQKEMGDLSRLTEKFEDMSLPIRMIKVAFNSNSNLRELVLKQAEKELGHNEELREIFIKCQFDLGEVLHK